MKIKSSLYFILSLLILICSACSKEEESGGSSNSDNVTDPTNGFAFDKRLESIQINNDGMMYTVQYEFNDNFGQYTHYTLPDEDSIEFTYEDDKISITYNDSEFSSVTEFKYNNGKIIRERRYAGEENVDLERETTWEYTSSGKLDKLTTKTYWSYGVEECETVFYYDGIDLIDDRTTCLGLDTSYNIYSWDDNIQTVMSGYVNGSDSTTFSMLVREWDGQKIMEQSEYSKNWMNSEEWVRDRKITYTYYSFQALPPAGSLVVSKAVNVNNAFDAAIASREVKYYNDDGDITDTEELIYTYASY